MRELLVAFIIALILGSIINDMQQHKPAAPAQTSSQSRQPVQSNQAGQAIQSGQPSQSGQSGQSALSGQTNQFGQLGQGSQSAETAQPSQSTNTAAESSTSTSYYSSTGERRDYPDFTSFMSVDSTNFDNLVLKSEKPVLIDCYVPNNLACDRMVPLVAAVSKAHEDSVIVAKLNVMDNLVLAHRYGVGTVPTFLLFNKGMLVNKVNGVVPQDRLESLIATINQSASSQQNSSSSMQ